MYDSFFFYVNVHRFDVLRESSSLRLFLKLYFYLCSLISLLMLSM